MDSEEYVRDLFESEREGIKKRFEWIEEHEPDFPNGLLIPGGVESSHLFYDAQMCYVYGIYTGTIALGQAFIERSVCGKAYQAGEFSENDRPGYTDAVKFLDDKNILGPTEVDGIALDELNELRNPIVHFRKPLDESSMAKRTIERLENQSETNISMSELVQEDAESILKTVFSVSKLYRV